MKHLANALHIGDRELLDAITFRHSGNNGELYIDQALLKPADVVLTKGAAKASEAIALMTDGPFSHAAIVVSPANLFESLDVGLVYTHLTLDRPERIAQGYRLLSKLPRVECALVLRHPSLEARDVHEGDSLRIMDILQPFLGLEYPDLVRLLGTLQDKPIRRRLAAILVKLRVHQRGTTKIIPGPFCSQLVATIYQKMGLQCFSAPIDPSRISPNSFLSSKLKAVKGAITHLDAGADVDRKLVDMVSDIVPESVRTGEVSLQTVRFKKTVAELEAKTGAFLQAFGYAAQKLAERQKCILEAIECYRVAKDADSASREE